MWLNIIFKYHFGKVASIKTKLRIYLSESVHSENLRIDAESCLDQFIATTLTLSIKHCSMFLVVEMFCYVKANPLYIHFQTWRTTLHIYIFFQCASEAENQIW